MSTATQAATVGAIMRRNLVVVPVTAPLVDAAAMMADRHISGLLVVDADSGPVGVVTQADLIARVLRPAGLAVSPPDPQWLESEGARAYLESFYADGADDEERAATVADIMSGTLVDVLATMPLTECAHFMVREGIHRVFVTEQGRVVGVVSTMDIMRAISQERV